MKLFNRLALVCLLAVATTNVWAVDPEPIGCFCITATEANTVVKFPSKSLLKYYTTAEQEWKDYNVSNKEITLANIGDKVYFKAMQSQTSLSKLAFASTTGKFSVSGDLLMLLNENPSDATMVEQAFQGLFLNCENIVSAEDLIMPDHGLTTRCFVSMFNGCTKLVTAPKVLPAKTLSQYCYSYMFNGCSSLVNSPMLPAAELVPFCYERMFQGCSSLQAVKIYATDHSASNCVNTFLSGIPGSGTFECLSGTTWTGVVPAGWDVKHVVPLTVSSVGSGTFATAYPLDFTNATGVSAYVCTGLSGTKLNMQPVEKVAANTGLYISAPAGDYYIPEYEPVGAYSEINGTNYLTGNTSGATTHINQEDGVYTNFILQNQQEGGLKFYIVNSESGNDVANGRAYLHLPTAMVTPASAKDFLDMSFDEDATAIAEIQNSKFNIQNSAIYNMAGHKVGQLDNSNHSNQLQTTPTLSNHSNQLQTTPTLSNLPKGVYIVNGKKYLVK